MAGTRKTRPVSWLKTARREFEKFPEGARMVCLTALTIAAEGGKADIAKPLQGVGSGVLEIALPLKGDAFRVVYALQLGPDIWVIHVFQKKSTTGIKTPKREIDLLKDRLKRLQEILK
jgi:phage-related protein